MVEACVTTIKETRTSPDQWSHGWDEESEWIGEISNNVLNNLPTKSSQETLVNSVNKGTLKCTHVMFKCIFHHKTINELHDVVIQYKTLVNSVNKGNCPLSQGGLAPVEHPY